jgi:hypothetical protein
MRFRSEVSSTGQSGTFMEEPAGPCVLHQPDGCDWRNLYPCNAFVDDGFNQSRAISQFDQFLIDSLPVDKDNLIENGDIGSFIDDNDSQFESSSDSGNSIQLESVAIVPDLFLESYNSQSWMQFEVHETPSTPAATPALTYVASTPPESQASPRVHAITPNPHPVRQVSHPFRSRPRSDLESRQRRTKPVSKDHHCKYKPCEYKAQDAKDVGRHELQVHQKPKHGDFSQGWYACRCTYSTSRKDDLTRHLKTCKKDHVYSTYMCQCLGPVTNLDEFYKHISKCGAKPRGRPKHLSPPSPANAQLVS